MYEYYNYNLINVQKITWYMYTKSVGKGTKMTPSKKNKKMQQITIKLKVVDLNRLREYADKKGGNPVSHYIREAVAEYLEKHYDKKID